MGEGWGRIKYFLIKKDFKIRGLFSVMKFLKKRDYVRKETYVNI